MCKCLVLAVLFLLILRMHVYILHISESYLDSTYFTRFYTVTISMVWVVADQERINLMSRMVMLALWSANHVYF